MCVEPPRSLLMKTRINWNFKNPLANHLEKAMAPHSSTPAWKIPWPEEPGRLQSMGPLRVGHNWATSLSLFTFLHWRRKWQPTPVFLPGESQGRGSLVAAVCGVTESDTTEATQQPITTTPIALHSHCASEDFSGFSSFFPQYATQQQPITTTPIALHSHCASEDFSGFSSSFPQYVSNWACLLGLPMVSTILLSDLSYPNLWLECLEHLSYFLNLSICCCCYLVSKSCLTAAIPWTICYLPGFPVHGTAQARILEWVVISFSRGSSRSRARTCISCTGRQILYHWATKEGSHQT